MRIFADEQFEARRKIFVGRPVIHKSNLTVRASLRGKFIGVNL
jgi:hypothetical protein